MWYMVDSHEKTKELYREVQKVYNAFSRTNLDNMKSLEGGGFVYNENTEELVRVK